MADIESSSGGGMANIKAVSVPKKCQLELT